VEKLSPLFLRFSPPLHEAAQIVAEQSRVLLLRPADEKRREAAEAILHILLEELSDENVSEHKR